MNKNKQIIKLCPNFYKIVNFDYYESDIIFEKLLKVYENYIFSININHKDEVSMAKGLDTILSTYIDDYMFRKEVKVSFLNNRVRINNNNILYSIVDYLIKLFEKYEYQTTRNIYVTRWI